MNEWLKLVISAANATPIDEPDGEVDDVASEDEFSKALGDVAHDCLSLR